MVFVMWTRLSYFDIAIETEQKKKKENIHINNLLWCLNVIIQFLWKFMETRAYLMFYLIVKHPSKTSISIIRDRKWMWAEKWKVYRFMNFSLLLHPLNTSYMVGDENALIRQLQLLQRTIDRWCCQGGK